MDTANILFICGGAFVGLNNIIAQRIGKKTIGFGTEHISEKTQNMGVILRQVEPEYLLKFGLIPEFVGRIPVVTTLDELSEDDLMKILVEPKNALLKQYMRLFEMENVELDITEKARSAVAQEAIKRKTGARGLRAILENIMLDVMYHVPSTDNVKKVLIGEEVILHKAEPLMIFEDESSEEERKLRIS